MSTACLATVSVTGGTYRQYEVTFVAGADGTATVYFECDAKGDRKELCWGAVDSVFVRRAR